MSAVAWTVARKEIVDHVRDKRALLSATLYAVMGPVIAILILLSRSGGKHGQSTDVAAMLSVFALVSALVGGSAVALDSLAGERERRSLAPLLMNPVRTIDIMGGKWIAVSSFGAAALFINLLACSLVWICARGTLGPAPRAYALGFAVAGLLCLIPLAAAVELFISTACRTVKEAQPYTSIMVFASIGIGMLVVFLPQSAQQWWFLIPVAGQQFMIDLARIGQVPALTRAILLGVITLTIAAGTLVGAARLLQRDEIVFGS